jgi:CBS-domain-containing membrane protein
MVKQKTTRSKRVFRITRYIIYKETMINPKEILWAFLGSFIGISIMGLLQSKYFGLNDSIFLIGSFGASSVLVFGIPTSPLAKPRNVIGGHFISALIGVSISKIFIDQIWLAAALAVASSIVMMQITKTLHPPGGATSLLACIGSPKILELGYLYPFTPVLCGAIILVGVALLTNREYHNSCSFKRLKRFRLIAWIYKSDLLRVVR